VGFIIKFRERLGGRSEERLPGRAVFGYGGRVLRKDRRAF
jgi:hypothetical protein